MLIARHVLTLCTARGFICPHERDELTHLRKLDKLSTPNKGVETCKDAKIKQHISRSSLD